MDTTLAPEVLHSIEELANQEKRTASDIVADALELYKAQKKMSDIEFLYSIVGLGKSNQDDVSERDEEILASEIDPIRGWHIDDNDRDST